MEDELLKFFATEQDLNIHERPVGPSQTVIQAHRGYANASTRFILKTKESDEYPQAKPGVVEPEEANSSHNHTLLLPGLEKDI